MAEIESERSSTGLAFIVGGLVVAVLLIGYFLLRNDGPGPDDVNVDVTVPSAPAVPVEPAPPAGSTAPATPPASGSTTP